MSLPNKAVKLSNGCVGLDLQSSRGDAAADPAMLIQAHIARASMRVIAPLDTFDVRQMIKIDGMLNAETEAVICTHRADAAQLERGTAEKVSSGKAN